MEFTVFIDNLRENVVFSCRGCVPDALKPHLKENQGNYTVSKDKVSAYLRSIGRSPIDGIRAGVEITPLFQDGAEHDCGCGKSDELAMFLKSQETEEPTEFQMELPLEFIGENKFTEELANKGLLKEGADGAEV